MFRHICKSGSVAETVNIIVATEDFERLLAIMGDQNCPLKHVQKAKNVLFLPSVWRFWKSRADTASCRARGHRLFVRRIAVSSASGAADAGSARDKTAGQGAALGQNYRQSAGADLFRGGGRSHPLIGRAMAKAVNMSQRAVQCLWGAFIASTASPSHPEAIKRSLIRRKGRGRRWPLHEPATSRRCRDEKVPNSSSRSRRAESATEARQVRDHDARLETQQLRFLKAAARAVPAGKAIPAILDNYDTDHPRWTFHFTPTSAALIGYRLWARLRNLPQASVMTAARNAVLMPNNSTPLAASSAPIIFQLLSSFNPEAPRVVIESTEYSMASAGVSTAPSIR
jgi:hypothetical protein